MASRIGGILERLLGRRLEAAVSEVVTDSELLQRFVATRDEAAFELLMWRHGAMVLGLCRRAVRDEQLAEDAFQAVFLVLARKAGAIRTGNVGGWLFRVARRVAARAKKSRPIVKPVVDTTANPPTSVAEDQEISEILDAEVSRLPDRLRRAVILCYLGGRTTEDAARELGCPRGTVLSRLATARTRLADRLMRRGVVAPAVLVVTGVAPCGRLVSATISSVPAFLNGKAQPGTIAGCLAEGVIRTMTRATLATSLAGIALAASLVWGVGWVAAQGQSGTTAQLEAQPSDVKSASQKGPAPVTPRRENSGVDEKQQLQLAKLEERRQELAKQIEKLEAEAESVRQRFAVELQERRARLEGVQTDYNLDRELAMEDVRDAASHLRTTQRQVTAAEIELGNTSAHYQNAKQKEAAAEKDLAMRRDSLKRLTAEKGRTVEALRGTVAHLEAEIATRVQKLEAQRSHALEALAWIESQIEATKSHLAGVPFQAGAGIEAKLDTLIRAVGDLRKDVRGLTKPER